MAPLCPHCKVQMWEYERVQKADGPYGRYECKTQHCPNCGGGKCGETRGQTIR
jgi:hypothetical protein